jgi:hypothetical protein
MEAERAVMWGVGEYHHKDGKLMITKAPYIKN